MPTHSTASRSNAQEREERAHLADETTQWMELLPPLPTAQLLLAPHFPARPSTHNRVSTLLSVVDQFSTAASLDAVALTASSTSSPARLSEGNRPHATVATLVFASAKKPGGGWRRGSRAQEEDLSLASTWDIQAERSTGFYGKDATWMGPASVLSAHGFWIRDPQQQLLAPLPGDLCCGHRSQPVLGSRLQPKNQAHRDSNGSG